MIITDYNYIISQVRKITYENHFKNKGSKVLHNTPAIKENSDIIVVNGGDEMKFLIRKMKQDDILEVQYVAETSWHATYEGIIPRKIQDNFLKHAYSEKMLKQRIEISTIIVAEVGGKVVGFANFSSVSNEGVAELGTIYLLPEYQGNSIGTALLKKGITYLSEVKKIFINVEKDNEIGKKFYKAKGFEMISTFDENFDGHILKTIRMELTV